MTWSSWSTSRSTGPRTRRRRTRARSSPRELEAGQALARAGALRRLWRIPGRWANWSLYDVARRHRAARGPDARCRSSRGWTSRCTRWPTTPTTRARWASRPPGRADATARLDTGDHADRGPTRRSPGARRATTRSLRPGSRSCCATSTGPSGRAASAGHRRPTSRPPRRPLVSAYAVERRRALGRLPARLRARPRRRGGSRGLPGRSHGIGRLAMHCARRAGLTWRASPATRPIADELDRWLASYGVAAARPTMVLDLSVDEIADDAGWAQRPGGRSPAGSTAMPSSTAARPSTSGRPASEPGRGRPHRPRAAGAGRRAELAGAARERARRTRPRRGRRRRRAGRRPAGCASSGLDVLVVERQRALRRAATTPRCRPRWSRRRQPRWQREAGVEDSPEQFLADIMAKTGGRGRRAASPGRSPR